MGDVVIHKVDKSLGVGLVMECWGIDCLVQWAKTIVEPDPCWHRRVKLEVISESR